MTSQREFDAKLALAFIVLFTLLAIFLPQMAEIDGWASERLGWILFAALMIVSIYFLLAERLLLLPARRRGKLSMPSSFHYASTMAITTLGIAASVMTGQGLLALPFGAVALISFIVVAMYLRDSPAAVAVS